MKVIVNRLRTISLQLVLLSTARGLFSPWDSLGDTTKSPTSESVDRVPCRLRCASLVHEAGVRGECGALSPRLLTSMGLVLVPASVGIAGLICGKRAPHVLRLRLLAFRSSLFICRRLAATARSRVTSRRLRLVMATRPNSVLNCEPMMPMGRPRSTVPYRIAAKPTTFPAGVTGTTSPYPTVVMVARVHQAAAGMLSNGLSSSVPSGLVRTKCP
mmetsp:Transcript_78582/g.254557  ORF Transcript_78582/g.254557 Transcript_78582/m.254557 type:complete len:215 (+) Transcript_78582:663-1307(+)